MNKKAKQHFALMAIGNVFGDDPIYLCDRLFKGDWLKMYEYITNNLSDCTSIKFPNPAWTDIADDWTDAEIEENVILMCERWESYLMGHALKEAWNDEYYAVRYALECGLTLEDLK